MVSTFLKLLAALFAVGILAVFVAGSLVPLAIMAAVGFSLVCVFNALGRL